MYSEVVEGRSNYKKSYLLWFRNPTSDYSTKSDQIEKNQVGVPAWILSGKGGGWVMWFSVCKPPLDDSANFDSTDVFFTYGGYVFSYMGN